MQLKENNFKEVYTNEQGYAFYIDIELTNWANRSEEDEPYLVYLVKNKNIALTRLFVNNKEKRVLDELPLEDTIHQLCARIDVVKLWSKEED
jgi:hypothetical protein